MTASEAFQHISAYQEAHRAWPSKAYVSQGTAEWLSMGCFRVLDHETLKFGVNTLGVTEWHVDPSLDDNTIRLEPA